MSVRLAALITAPSGTPRRSLRICRLVPNLARLVGSGPVSSPPRGGRHGGTVSGLPVPADPVLGIVALQLVTPQSAPDALLDPLLEATVTGGSGAELARHRLPLTAGPQHMEDTVEHPAEGDDWSTWSLGWFLWREQRLALCPERIWHCQF